MIFVDSSVWIDYFNGKKTPQSDWLDESLGNSPILMGDLVLTEVLQGFQNDKDVKTAKDLLLALPFMTMGGRDLSIQSAINSRKLREKGVSVRKTVDVIIGTFCIYYQLPLLHDDRDFDPMARFLGLRIIDA